MNNQESIVLRLRRGTEHYKMLAYLASVRQVSAHTVLRYLIYSEFVSEKQREQDKITEAQYNG